MDDNKKFGDVSQEDIDKAKKGNTKYDKEYGEISSYPQGYKENAVLQREIWSDHHTLADIETPGQIPLLQILGHRLIESYVNVIFPEIRFLEVIRYRTSCHPRPYHLDKQRIARRSRINPLQRIQEMMSALVAFIRSHHR